MPNRARQIIPFPKVTTTRQPAKAPKRKRWPVILLCSLLTLYLVGAGVQWARQEVRLRALTAQYEEMLLRQQQLQVSNEMLQQRIQSLLKDPSYLEQLAREMGMVRPGDTIYLLSDPIP